MTALALRGSTAQLAPALGLPPEANPVLVTLAAVLGFYPLIALLERAFPHRREWSAAHGDVRTDALHLLLTGPFTSAAFDATLRGAAVAAGAALSARLGHGLWPSHWPALAQLTLALLVAELGHYGFHRLSHEHPLVWRLHAVHHSAPRLYWLNATRFHPLDLFALISCQSLPLLALGIDARAMLAYTLFAVVYGQLQHANLELRTGWLDRVFSTPGLHRFHHSTDPLEGNRNYGAILIAWDVAFRSFLRPPGREFAGPVGLAALPRFPTGYLGQLAAPLRWARIRRENGDPGARAGLRPPSSAASPRRPRSRG
jgi:sterol desaturase/sphingolipid hydroxylase (fatty acid hydroxylase superfamily)